MKTILYIIIALFISCEKSTIEQNSGKEPSIVWKKQLGPVGYDQISFEPILYQNDLLFGYQTENTQGYYRINKQTGVLVKSYDNINSFDYTSYLIDNKYFSIFGKKGRTINLQTNEIVNFIINYEFNVSSIFMSTSNKNSYLAVKSNANYSANDQLNEYKIMRANNDNLNFWNVVWANKYTKEEAMFGVDVKYLLAEKNKEGDDLIYFPSQLGFKDVNTPSKYKVEAVNLTQNKLIWEAEPFKVDSFNSHGLSNFPPQLYNDLVITGISGRHLMAFNKNTGKKVWSFYFEDAILDTQMIIYSDKITIMDNSRNLYLIDANTGTLLRKQVIIGGAGANWSLHKGLVYFTTASGKLYCVDANNLDIKWELRSPNKDKCSYCTFYNASPVVDPETNRLYISDRKEVMCYQLP